MSMALIECRSEIKRLKTTLSHHKDQAAEERKQTARELKNSARALSECQQQCQLHQRGMHVLQAARVEHFADAPCACQGCLTPESFTH
jgi:hypothetical protein